MSDLQAQLDPTPSQVLEALAEGIGADLRVAIPGIVQQVESTDPPRITVAPAVQRHKAAHPDPAIPGVPVAVMASGGATVALPVAVGDPVWLMVSDRELDGWLAKHGGSAVEAQEPRTHDLADCVAYPMDVGSLPTGAAGNLWLGLGGASLKMDSSGGLVATAALTAILTGLTIKLGSAATEPVIKGTTFSGLLNAAITAWYNWINSLATIQAEWSAAASSSIPWSPKTSTQNDFSAKQLALAVAILALQNGTASYLSTKVTTE